MLRYIRLSQLTKLPHDRMGVHGWTFLICLSWSGRCNHVKLAVFLQLEVPIKLMVNAMAALICKTIFLPHGWELFLDRSLSDRHFAYDRVVPYLALR